MTNQDDDPVDLFSRRLDSIREQIAPYFVGARSRDEAISRMPFALRAATRTLFAELDEAAAERET